MTDRRYDPYDLPAALADLIRGDGIDPATAGLHAVVKSLRAHGWEPRYGNQAAAAAYGFSAGERSDDD